MLSTKRTLRLNLQEHTEIFLRTERSVILSDYTGKFFTSITLSYLVLHNSSKHEKWNFKCRGSDLK